MTTDKGRDEHPELPFDPDAPDDGAGARPLHLTGQGLGLVFAGGAAGTATRYGLEVLMPTTTGNWPYGTFVANLAGAFVLGVLLESLARAGRDDGWRRRCRLLVGTGFCGGLTTYSTFAVEADLLIRSHDAATAVGYLVATVVAGLIMTMAGVAAAIGHHRRRQAAS